MDDENTIAKVDVALATCKTHRFINWLQLFVCVSIRVLNVVCFFCTLIISSCDFQSLGGNIMLVSGYMS